MWGGTLIVPMKIAYRKQKPLNHVLICFDGNVYINVEQMKTAAGQLSAADSFRIASSFFFVHGKVILIKAEGYGKVSLGGKKPLKNRLWA